MRDHLVAALIIDAERDTLFAAEKLFERALTVHARNAYALAALADIERKKAAR